MKRVIDIDKEILQGIIEGEEDEPRNIVRSFQATIADAIKKGTPLPEGHGRWIDGKCNRCGTHAPFWPMASTYYCSNYCPHCGAKMAESEE